MLIILFVRINIIKECEKVKDIISSNCLLEDYFSNKRLIADSKYNTTTKKALSSALLHYMCPDEYSIEHGILTIKNVVRDDNGFGNPWTTLDVELKKVKAIYENPDFGSWGLMIVMKDSSVYEFRFLVCQGKRHLLVTENSLDSIVEDIEEQERNVMKLAEELGVVY